MNATARPAQLLAETARQSCGCNFRLHGRDPQLGLDCIGLVEHCVKAAGRDIIAPNGYAIRQGQPRQFAEFMENAGFAVLPQAEAMREGDILLVRPHPVQLHLLVRLKDGCVHAHAGLGKVVFTPGAPSWPVILIFRLQEG
ncbi:peptidoglycan endopeptidase [Parasphingorhabdus sp.]|jgi:hypothetical protein|uniref:peptidoglycan endopeptidase n=1 Tax=Parasphingorhabdus sp. TaxID=2709688 RepID=UPI003D26D19B